MARAQVKGDKLRAIGVTSSGRSALAPDLPSMAEVGVPDFNLEIWNAVAEPKSMPPAMVAKLAAMVSDIARTPEVRQNCTPRAGKWWARHPKAWPNGFRQIPECMAPSSKHWT